jgi:preprotein translocase subunit Sec63
MQVLGVAQTATHAEIRKAYKQLALRLHPDKPGGDEEMFKLVSGAYEVRTNAHVRTEGACWLPTRATSHSTLHVLLQLPMQMRPSQPHASCALLLEPTNYFNMFRLVFLEW